jgi:hypothetical protein
MRACIIGCKTVVHFLLKKWLKIHVKDTMSTHEINKSYCSPCEMFLANLVH